MTRTIRETEFAIRKYGRGMRIRAVHTSAIPGIESASEGVGRYQVGAFAHHIDSEDGLFVYVPNDDFTECTSIALCEVVSSDPESGFCTLDVRKYVGVVNPPKAVAYKWRKNPYLCPDKKRVLHYGLLEMFSECFNDPGWAQRKLEDAVNTVFRPDLNKPTLGPVSGYVYLLKSQSEYKIGKAIDIGKRQKQIEKDVGEKLELVHQIKTDDYTRTEAELHIKYAHLRTHGEWFNLSSREVEQIIAMNSNGATN